MSTTTSSTDFNSIGRSFSAAETTHSHGSSARGSHAVSPSKVIQDLVFTLQNHHVTGPFLLRSKTEFTNVLGQGVYSEVRGVDAEIIKKCNSAGAIKITNISGLRFEAIAVKQHRARRLKTSPKAARDYLGRHFQDAVREIRALTSTTARNHPNIVKLLGWGLCLDALEDHSLEKASIPLLIMEKADGDLYNILQADARYSTSQISFAERAKICADVGNGLKAMHDLSLSHGDLKTHKVLIFSTANGLTAKLCGFDTAIGHHSDLGLSVKETSYKGTPGWRPPEVLASAQIPDPVKCDIYAYGLVVWSVFANDGRNCLDTTAEWSVKVRDRAVASIRTHLPTRTISQRSLRDSVLAVIHDSLSHEPSKRNLQPWRHLTTVAQHTTHALYALLKEASFSASPANKPSKVITKKQKITIKTHSGALSPYKKTKAYASFARHAGFESELESSHSDQLYPDPNGVNLFEHKTDSCLDAPWLTKLHTRVYDALTSKRSTHVSICELQGQDLVYCYARYRSRFKLCCWSRYCSRAENVLQAYLNGPYAFDFGTFAWLCRGQTGAADVARISMSEVVRHFCSDRFDESQRLQCFALLSQNGLSLEALVDPGIKPSPRSEQIPLLLKFVSTLREPIVDTAMRLICKRFSAYQHSDSIADSTIAFLLGKDARGRNNKRMKTALHEFTTTFNYEAVENLLRIGADPNVEVLIEQDMSQLAVIRHRTLRWRPSRKAPPTLFRPKQQKNGTLQSSFKNVLQLALACQPIDRKQALARERIVALLISKQTGLGTPPNEREEQANPRTPLLKTLRQLPQGWSAQNDVSIPLFLGNRQFLKSVMGGKNDRFSLPRYAPKIAAETIYFEKFTGSVTWKRPSFSLLSGGRVALEHRRLHGYYLDFIAFITPPMQSGVKKSIQHRFPVIDDTWYLQEPFTEMATDNPLSELVEHWSARFVEPETRKSFSLHPVLMPSVMIFAAVVLLIVLMWLILPGFAHDVRA